MALDNLYIIGVPRSMTSIVYRRAVETIGGWRIGISDGEVLNVGRVAFPINATHAEYCEEIPPHWTRGKQEEKLEILELLHASKQFFVVKDVITPQTIVDFVLAKAANALVTIKDPVSAAYSCAVKDWYYPCHYLGGVEDAETLVQAVEAMYVYEFSRLRGCENVHFIQTTDLARDANALWEPLRSLGYEPRAYNYVEAGGFQEKAAKVAAYTETELYQRLKGYSSLA